MQEKEIERLFNEAKKRKLNYISEYNKKNYKRVTLMISLSKEAVIKKLSSVNSMSGYIIKLIEEDLKNEK